jgi:cell division protein FtsL
MWTLAVVAATCSFVLYLSMRNRAMELGYKLGKARGRQTQLLETKRVLQVEAIAYKNPQRIENIAKGVLQMEEPPPERIFIYGAAVGTTIPSASASSSASSMPSTEAP